MTKRTLTVVLFIAAAVVLLAGGAMSYALRLTHEDKVAMAGQVGTRYQGYTKQAFDQASDKRRVLFFYANWCPICRPADASYKADADKIPEDVRVFRINILDSDTGDEERAVAKKYNVPYQHTYVLVDSEGKTVKVWSGGEIAELLENLR